MINSILKINKDNFEIPIYINEGGSINNISEILLMDFNNIEKINYLLEINCVIRYISHNYHFFRKNDLDFYNDFSIKNKKNDLFILSYSTETSKFFKKISNEDNINYNYLFENDTWYYLKSYEKTKYKLKELFIFLNIFDLINEKDENITIEELVKKFNNSKKIKINEIELFNVINYFSNINKEDRNKIFEDIRPFSLNNFERIIYSLKDKLFKIKLYQEIDHDLNNKKEKEKRKI